MASGNAVIGSLRANLGLDSAQFNRGMDRAQGKTRSFATALKRNIAAAATAAVASLALIASRAARAAEEIAAIGDAADRVNVSVDFLEKVKAALVLEGQPDTGVEKSLRRFSQAVADAADGSQTAIDAFQSLGVDIEALNERGASLEEIFFRVSRGLQVTRDGMTRTAAAADLFGRSGGELNAVLQKGPTYLKNLFDRAADLKLVYGEDLVRATQKLNAELGVQERQIDVRLNKAWGELSSVTQLLNKLWAFTLEGLAGLKIGFERLAGSIGRAIAPLVDYVGEMIGFGDELSRVLGLVREFDAANAAKGAIVGGLGGGALGLQTPSTRNRNRDRTGGGSVNEFAAALEAANKRISDIDLENIYGAGTIALKRLRFEIELSEAAMKQFGDISQDQIALISEMGSEYEEVLRNQELLTDLTQTYNEVTEEARRIAEEAAENQRQFWLNASNGIANAISRADSFKDALAQIGIELARLAINDIFSGQSQIGQLLGIGGNIFGSIVGGGASSSVSQSVKTTKFAKGGLVTRPTMFGFGGGLGIAGEAGTEAIMPVAQGPDGTMGVRAFGGSGGDNYYIDARGAVEGTAALIRRELAAHDRRLGSRYRAAQAGGKV